MKSTRTCGGTGPKNKHSCGVIITTGYMNYTHLSYGLLPHICAALFTSQVKWRETIHLKTVIYHAIQGSSCHRYAGRIVGSTKVIIGIRIA